MESTTTETPIVVEDDKEMVLYCDGSARPNPGDIGFGFHGYMYNITPPKKGTGLASHKLTALGYVPKEGKDSNTAPEVTPLMYFDGFGCTGLKTSNNVAELLAASASVDIAAQYPVRQVTLKTDSEYVRRGFEEWSPIWIRNRWIKNDGTPVPNQDIWKDLLRKINVLSERGTNVNVKWVKGHAEVFGNERADRMAVIGTMNSKLGNSKVEVLKRPPEKYWNADSTKHPMLSQRRMYFNTLRNSHVKGEYFLGDHGKDDEFLGKRDADGALSVVQLQKPETALELIRDYQTTMSGDFDALVIVNLDTLYTKSRNTDLENYGIGALVRADPYRLNLSSLDKEPLTHECRPPRIAQRALECLSILKSCLLNYRADKLRGYYVTDITSTIYDDVEKTVKKEKIVEKVLNSSFIVGHKVHPVTVQAPDDTTVDLKLTMGLDIPDRNTLKRLEDPNICVKVLVWQEAPNAIRFATVVTNGNDYGIWAGFYSNLVFLPEKA